MPEKSEKEYRRLRGSGRDTFAVFTDKRYTLWVGRDHLLHVTNSHYSETYKRFYFNDIQALTLHKSVHGKVINGILGGIAGFFLVLALAGIMDKWSAAGMVFVSTVGAVFGLFLLVNWLMGPTCVATIQTAVQAERLYSLHRMKTALKVFGQLRPIIEAVQGAVSAEILSKYHATSFDATAGRRGPAQGVRKVYSSRAHVNLFLWMLLAAAYSGLRFVVGNHIMSVVLVLLTLGMIVSVAMALVKQHGTNLPMSVKVMAWSTLAYLFMGYMCFILLSGIIPIAYPDSASSEWGYLQLICTVSPLEFTTVGVMLIILGLTAAGMGVSGLMELGRFYKNRSIPPPVGMQGMDS